MHLMDVLHRPTEDLGQYGSQTPMDDDVTHQGVRTKEPLADISELKLYYADLPATVGYTLAAECASYDLMAKADA